MLEKKDFQRIADAASTKANLGEILNTAMEKALEEEGFDYNTDSEAFVKEYLYPEIDKNHRALLQLELEYSLIQERLVQMKAEQVELMDKEIAFGILQNILSKRWDGFEPVHLWHYEHSEKPQSFAPADKDELERWVNDVNRSNIIKGNESENE